MVRDFQREFVFQVAVEHSSSEKCRCGCICA